MKFLNLETGYTFDGIWKNTTSYTEWTIVDRIVPIKCDKCDYVTNINDSELIELMSNSNIELLYSDNEYAKNPDDSLDWYSEFNYETTCKYAYRTKITQTKGYIYWFPNEQSTGIVYTMPICVLTEDEKPLNISIEENSVFVFVRTTNVTTSIDDYTFIEPEFLYSITTEPQKLDKYYAHVFHIACKSEMAGEYICKVKLDDEHYFRVGADLYGEYEPVRINLSNMGVELPEIIQKSIYDVDPHEDAKDNIVINRKFKELLINYWDIVANKGSYKSLVNSIKWFEWQNIEIKEIWKHLKGGKFVFDDRQVMSLFENKLNDRNNNFIKTNYVSLYCSLYDELNEYDDEMNPVLSKALLKWSQDDLRLKMSLLAQFFGLHFMPIHLSLLHAVVEDKVFTSTIKSINGAEIKRDDIFSDFNYVECSIKEKQRFVLSNVRTQVTDNTMYGIKDCNDTTYFGVDIFPKNAKIDSINVFASKYYTGPGVVIPIEFSISNQYDDFLKHTIVSFDNNRLDFYDIVHTKNNKINIKFNLLIKHAKDYSYTFTFITASGKVFVKNINFSVSDPDGMWINVYKILSKDDSNGFTYDDFIDMTVSKYVFKIQKSNNYSYYRQYLPYMSPSDSRYNTYNGIKLNRTIVLKIKSKTTSLKKLNDLRKSMSERFLEFAKYDGKILKYLIYVSKYFYDDTPNDILTNNSNVVEIVRNELGFYPQFHKMELLNGNTINDYTINQFDSLCCVPVTISKNRFIDFKYGKEIGSENTEWEFINTSLLDDAILHPNSSQQPFIAKSDESLLEPGIYNIKFKYRLSDNNVDYKEFVLNSAFKVVYI